MKSNMPSKPTTPENAISRRHFLLSASLGCDQVPPKIVEPGVLALEVPAVREDTVPFALQFTGTPVKPAMRPFAAGPVGEVTP